MDQNTRPALETDMWCKLRLMILKNNGMSGAVPGGREKGNFEFLAPKR